MRLEHYIWKLRRPLSEYDSNMVDYMIVKSNIGGYRLLVWKEGIQIFIYFMIRNQLFTNISNCKISRLQAISRIESRQWIPIIYNVYRTEQRLVANNQHGIPSNFNHYPLTYFRMITIRNYQNQLDFLLQKRVTSICPTIHTIWLRNWLLYIINNRRQRNVLQELQLLPPVRNRNGVLIFPGGIMFQNGNIDFRNALELTNTGYRP